MCPSSRFNFGHPDSRGHFPDIKNCNYTCARVAVRTSWPVVLWHLASESAIGYRGSEEDSDGDDEDGSCLVRGEISPERLPRPSSGESRRREVADIYQGGSLPPYWSILLLLRLPRVSVSVRASISRGVVCLSESSDSSFWIESTVLMLPGATEASEVFRKSFKKLWQSLK